MKSINIRAGISDITGNTIAYVSESRLEVVWSCGRVERKRGARFGLSEEQM
jgi:hypothetical protein